MTSIVPMGDDAPVLVRRWMVAAILAIVVPIASYAYRMDNRLAKIENSAASPTEFKLLEQRVASIEKLVVEYERLRYVREGQITKLQADLTNAQNTINQMRSEMNANFERLLYNRRSNGNGE